MQKIAIAIIVVLMMLALSGVAVMVHVISENFSSDDEVVTVTKPKPLFYEYSEEENMLKWNLYDGKKATMKSLQSGFSYYVFNKENQDRDENQLSIFIGDFSFKFYDQLEYTGSISNGKIREATLDLKKDLRNKWSNNKTKFKDSDITKRYSIDRTVTLYNSYSNDYMNESTMQLYPNYEGSTSSTSYDESQYDSYCMDIYVNSKKDIVFAYTKQAREISYVTKDKTDYDNVNNNKIRLESEEVSNINKLIDSLGEPNYAIASNDVYRSKLTYVWYIYKDYYFYYTMSEDYYILWNEKLKAPLTGTGISDYEYGVVNKNYIYYTREPLSRLFDAIDNNYNQEEWISIEENE